MARKIMHRRFSDQRLNLIANPIDAYILSLIGFDFIQGLGGSLNVHWIAQQSIDCSTYCTAQGALQLIGETGSAMATLTITVYTFLKVVFRLRLENRWIHRILLTFTWLYIVLFALVGAVMHHQKVESFFAPTPLWCWVGDSYPAERIAGEFVWLWLTYFVSFILYVSLFFVMKGGKYLNGGIHWKFLLYPIAYSVLVLPTFVTYWMGWGKHSTRISTGAKFAGIIMLDLTGFTNALLFLYLRNSVDLLEGFGKSESTSIVGPSVTAAPRKDLDQLEHITIEPPFVAGASLPD